MGETGTDKVVRCVDQVCALGCEAVTKVIADLGNGVERPEYAGLDAGQRRMLLAELVSIMAVYEGKTGD